MHFLKLHSLNSKKNSEKSPKFHAETRNQFTKVYEQKFIKINLFPIFPSKKLHGIDISL